VLRGFHLFWYYTQRDGRARGAELLDEFPILEMERAEGDLKSGTKIYIIRLLTRELTFKVNQV
jgi:hypothetical protein